MINRGKSGNYLDDLLGLWHGDKDSMGWISSTLACEIARVLKPADFDALAIKIYGRADNVPTHDFEVCKALRKGYVRYAKYYAKGSKAA